MFPGGLGGLKMGASMGQRDGCERQVFAELDSQDAYESGRRGEVVGGTLWSVGKINENHVS